MRLLPVALAAALLAGCQSKVTIDTPSISSSEFASSAKVPGRYAVMIQSGAWKKEVTTEGLTCGAWSFPTDFESAYASAVHDAFEMSFESVSFVPVALKPDEVRQQKFDGQIVVYEGGIKTVYGIREHLFSADAVSEVKMDGIVAVIGPEGLAGQASPQGAGVATVGIFTCSDGSKAVSEAGAKAVRDFVLHAVDAAKANVIQMRSKAQAQATPAS
ncbi:MAG: hypothetical protein KUL88_22585 [Rhizobium sp.]|nr:hypothetical protein [Rhizobium sp.]